MMTFLHCNLAKPYFWIYIDINASTFNPVDSLSSTDEYVHNNKQCKLQEVKDKLEFNNTDMQSVFHNSRYSFTTISFLFWQLLLVSSLLHVPPATALTAMLRTQLAAVAVSRLAQALSVHIRPMQIVSVHIRPKVRTNHTGHCLHWPKWGWAMKIKQVMIAVIAPQTYLTLNQRMHCILEIIGSMGCKGGSWGGN